MNTVNRKPLLVMIPLIAAFAVPAFAQQTQQGVQEAAAAQEQQAAQSQSDAAGAATSEAAEQPQQSEASSSSGQQGWNQLDTDKDGAISKQEASANPGLAQVFSQADGNADGKLTLAEYKAFVVKNYGG